MTTEHSSLTALLEHGVGRAWAGTNLGGVLCGSSKKSYNLPPKKELHSRERFRVLQQLRVESCCSFRANLSLSWPTSEGLKVVSSHLYCFPRRRVGSGHQSGSHQVSQNEMCPTCAHWKLAERHGCYTGMQAAPWITLVPCPPPLVLELFPRSLRD